jgi:hypothetical protein
MKSDVAVEKLFPAKFAKIKSRQSTRVIANCLGDVASSTFLDAEKSEQQFRHGARTVACRGHFAEHPI